MNRTSSSLGLFFGVAISTFIAFVLTIVQLPTWLFYFWPDWIALIIIYWSLVTPTRIGPLSAFIVGVLLEVLFVRTFGVLGLGLAILALLVNSAHQQLRVLSVWQQMVFVGLFVGIFKLVTGWLYGIVDDFAITKEYWYSILGGMLIWPFVYILLEEMRRKARIR
ncbi:rod shape-determining protein MreD [Arenicella xantha]|uniref:Rod shape-determining protein MreD n=1 Tax=Arenicella xantha TaxID=644221 RepID=A0A395JJL6_9GAMM|nr:rod shape-determining protein MreD [Arenicella xantha]RBP50922.1 rod shape-determining protein MreD [Arenicella xantha]